MATLKKIENIKVDKRFSHVKKQAQQKMGVKIKENLTLPSCAFDSDRWYVQIFTTNCSRILVLSTTDKKFSAALCDANFDWFENPYDTRGTYRSIENNAGIESPHPQF